jgi:formate hydrogenlyase subunit 6/NADH:ubiquinone oxidoreductase subunit I
MKIGTMLGDVVKSFFQAPVTERYPFERREAPERLRGKLVWDSEQCTGCGLCAKDCPASAIEVIVLDKAAKRFVLLYHVDRCTFCAQCVQSCRQGCLAMSSDQWELAAFDKGAFGLYYGDAEDVEAVLAGVVEPGDTPEEA